jgi:hypothetical protein
LEVSDGSREGGKLQRGEEVIIEVGEAIPTEYFMASIADECSVANKTGAFWRS